MNASIDNPTVTGQGSSVEIFEDNDVKTIVSQINGDTGTRKAQLMFAVGFLSMPVESDRLIVAEIGNGLHAIGGCCERLVESLGAESGDRLIVATDADGNLAAKIHLKNDGQINCGDGDEPVGMSGVIDKYFTVVDAMLTAVDALLPAPVYEAAMLAAFPETGGVLPSTASENLNADVIPPVPEP